MEEQANAAGSQGFKKDRTHVSEAGEAQGAGQPQNNGAVANGPNGVVPNGVLQDNGGSGAQSSSANPLTPPPLDQSWREGVENKSLGKLMIRTAEKCFTDLNDLIARMANEKVPQQAAQPNGVTSEQDTDAVSLKKKNNLMNFAQEQRERFIKALVINDWSKDAEAFAGIIDVNAHLGRSNFCHVQATTAVGEMKLAMSQAKMPNPNIEGALELLATGKSTLTDLGYITPPKMTGKELLRTLKDMNVTLATRLTLNEELPYHLNQYTVADGRATFTVPGEFAVDLAVADEDPQSPFFFIELRFLYSPAPEQLNDFIQNFCEMEVNKAIAAKGLQGCYDVLHNYVLTHKLTVLHSQVFDLLRGKWFDAISVQKVRRIVVVSYWTGRPGKKSWLELGIGSGRTKDGKTVLNPTPEISVRWFQRGVQVPDAKLDIDWGHIDLEAILLQAIAKHSSSLLRHVKDDLMRFVPPQSKFSAELSTSDDNPDDCALVMNLPSLRSPVRVIVEPITGQFSISPSTPATRKTQQRLNTDPTTDIPRRLASMISALVLESVDKSIHSLGWHPVVDLARQDNLRIFFGEDLWQREIFVPAENWGKEWAICLTVGLSGSRWWIVQLKEIDGAKHRVIVNARRLQTPATSDAMVSRRLLLQIEKAALAEVSYTSLAMELDHEHVPYHFEKPSLISSDASDAQQTLPAIFINFSRLMNPTREKNWKPWAQELVRLTHHGDDSKLPSGTSDRLLVRHDLRLALHDKSFKELRKHLTNNSHDQDLAMNETGGLAVKFRTPFGQPFMEEIREKLSAIKRLDHCLTVLKSCGDTCSTATLHRLAFTYGPNASLSAQLTFPTEPSQPIKLRLSPPDSNPHILIRALLEQNFNNPSLPPATAFSTTMHTLHLSLPVLQTIETLQKAHPTRASPLLHIRNVSWYSLKYKPPHPQITFSLRARSRADPASARRTVRWHIEQERTRANAESLPEELLKALREIWSDPGDEHFLGLGSGVAADAAGVGRALERIDGVVRGFEGKGVGESGDGGKKKEAAGGGQEVIALD